MFDPDDFNGYISQLVLYELGKSVSLVRSRDQESWFVKSIEVEQGDITKKLTAKYHKYWDKSTTSGRSQVLSLGQANHFVASTLQLFQDELRDLWLFHLEAESNDAEQLGDLYCKSLGLKVGLYLSLFWYTLTNDVDTLNSRLKRRIFCRSFTAPIYWALAGQRLPRLHERFMKDP
jgi:hypothetical protein